MTDEEKGKIQTESKEFILKHDYFCKVLFSITKTEQDWILNYMCSGKDVIQYEMMNSFNSLNITPGDDEFFKIEEFYSSLKNFIISEEEYNSVQKNYTLMKMRNLSEIFESRATFLNKKFKFNPRKCNSASSFSGCVQRDKSKCIIALPTNSEKVQLFEKTLIGGFSGVNTYLAFDTSILFPNKEDLNEKRDDLKIVYNLKINNENKKKRIVSKILKMNENNQYGNAMTKPLPCGCIKKQKTILLNNLILQNVSDEDNIGNLFIVDIKFDEKKTNEKTLLFNELYTPIFEKKKLVKPYERSVIQLLSVLLKNNEKTHSTMKKKRYFCHYTLNIYIF